MTDELKAAAYSQMTTSWAWNDFVSWMKERIDAAEYECLRLKPEEDSQFKAYFMGWQERKKFYLELMAQVEEVKQYKEQNDDERPHQQHVYGDPAGYVPGTGDTSTPGY